MFARPISICFFYLFNLGLAITEIEPMIKEAKNTRIDIFYELTADFEILKYTLVWMLNRWCKCGYWHPWHYVQKDLTKQWKWWKQLKKFCLQSCAREADNDAESSESEDEDKDRLNIILEKLRQEILQMPERPTGTKENKSNPRVVDKVITLRSTNRN